MPSSSGSSQFRDRARVSCIAGRFFTSEPPEKPLSKDSWRQLISPSFLQACSILEICHVSLDILLLMDTEIISNLLLIQTKGWKTMYAC